MYKAILLLLLLAAVAVNSVALVAKKEKLEMGSPVLAGSLIIALNQ